jgi:2-amino-4-hydroxy-6-hydroxymethyldihydropteridine diphosphokinase/dihydropteroate synthase
MVILGIGTNQGDRLFHLRRALHCIEKIPTLKIVQVSPLYVSDALLPENAPPEWNVPYVNLAVRCEVSLKPEELLIHTKNIEKILGRKPQERWGPRIIDIDILAWDDLIQYDDKLHIPHKNLHERPFALWPLSDVAPQWVYPFPGEFQGKTAAEISTQWGSRFSGDAPLHARQIPHRVDTPQLVGILNITPDSFSDGGKFLDPQNAVIQAKKLVEAGAEILDIGAESTGPKSSALDSKTEWERLEPVLRALSSELAQMVIAPKISIDTRHADVAKKALALGADWINDVSGLSDPAMCEIIAAQTCDVVFMHHLRIPEDRSVSLPLDQNPLPLVREWAEKKIVELEKFHISRDRMIFDIGVGYGKTSAQSLQLLKNIHTFRDLGVRLLVGHSRKSFLQQLTPLPAAERDLETVILSLHLAKTQTDYLRVHHVEFHARAFKVAGELEHFSS